MDLDENVNAAYFILSEKLYCHEQQVAASLLASILFVKRGLFFINQSITRTSQTINMNLLDKISI
jgi:hypothetical protein